MVHRECCYFESREILLLWVSGNVDIVGHRECYCWSQGMLLWVTGNVVIVGHRKCCYCESQEMLLLWVTGNDDIVGHRKCCYCESHEMLLLWVTGNVVIVGHKFHTLSLYVACWQPETLNREQITNFKVYVYSLQLLAFCGTNTFVTAYTTARYYRTLS